MNIFTWKGLLVYSLLLVTLGFTIASFTIKPKISLQVFVNGNILDFQNGEIYDYFYKIKEK